LNANGGLSPPFVVVFVGAPNGVNVGADVETAMLLGVPAPVETIEGAIAESIFFPIVVAGVLDWLVLVGKLGIVKAEAAVDAGNEMLVVDGKPPVEEVVVTGKPVDVAEVVIDGNPRGAVVAGVD